MPGSKSSAPAASHTSVHSDPVTLTVHSVNTPDLRDPLQAAQQRTRDGRLKMLLVLAVCAAPVIASYLTYFVIRPQGRNNYGELIAPSRSLPALALRDLNNKAVPAKSLQGQWLLVTVAGSACDSACDKRLFTQRQLREMLGKERDRVDKIWFVTDDKPLPEPLRAAVLAAPAASVLRVDRTALAGWLVPAPGQALEDHLYIVDPMGEWMMRLPVNPEPAKVKKDLERLLRASASWDQPGR
jgi:hypothetical protein